ncbi:ankyrin repeat domain-containing protein [Candidatus Similichlamydia laticola]|uniref:Uncharacterized protein n=1 Tax=Candidatus Similichlamydia laticola TaxID=2170265 RepID=A0A369KEI1_9BACT|nr:ankyrin repeat domain-containing protein [Candidatus Similichlamydia laticola]RDB31307.1 hypothetical protein HAT2_00590 [Candidatus Similichlamydia laticola]
MVDHVKVSFRDVLYGDSRAYLFGHFADSAFFQRLFLGTLADDPEFFLGHLSVLEPFWARLKPETWDISSAVHLQSFLEREEGLGSAEDANCFLTKCLKEMRGGLGKFLQLGPLQEVGFHSFSLSEGDRRKRCLELAQSLEKKEFSLREATHLGFFSFLSVASTELGWSLMGVDRYGNSLLHLAALNGDIEAVEFLIEKGLSYSAQNRKGRTAFHSATLSRNLSLMLLLLDSGADPLQQDRFSESPLFLAARLGCRSFLEAILGVRKLRSERFLKETNRAGQSLLHYAALHNGADLANYLISLGFYVNNPDFVGETPLHLGVRAGNMSVCSHLLAKGADPDRKNAMGKSPLHIAIDENKFDLVQLLIDHAAHINSADSLGQTALHLAIMQGSVDTVETLLREKADSSRLTVDKKAPLHLAVERNQARLVEMLCSFGAPLLTKDLCFRTPLHLACELGHFDCVESFLEHVPSEKIEPALLQTNLSGKNLIHAAVQGRNPKVLERILAHERRPSLDEADCQGVTPVHLAVRLGEKGCFDLLWKAGANFLVKDKKGSSPLHEACLANRPTMANKILESQPQTRIQQDLLGSLPLHLAAQQDSVACLELLLSVAPEDVNLQNSEGQTALHLCAAKGFVLSIRALSRIKGIRADIPDRKGQTPYDLAQAAGIKEEIESLFL